VQAVRAAIAARDEEARQRQATETERNRAVAAETEARTNEQKAKENERAAKYQALRAENARHAIQIDLALRAWERHDVVEAERVLGTMDESFQQTWESRHLRSLCRRKALLLLGHTAGVYCVAVSAGGERIGSGSDDMTVRVWEAATGKVQRTLTGHKDRVSSVAVSADGRRIVSGSWDGTVRVWDAATGQEQLTLKGHTLTVYSVAFSADGRRIVSGSGDKRGEVRVWD